MLCLVSVLRGCLVCLLLCKEEGYSSVSAITEWRDMGLYEVSLSMHSSFLDGDHCMLANFHMCGIILVLRAVFNMRVVQEGLCILGA